jgi:hypothetical protein
MTDESSRSVPRLIENPADPPAIPKVTKILQSLADDDSNASKYSVSLERGVPDVLVELVLPITKPLSAKDQFVVGAWSWACVDPLA